MNRQIRPGADQFLLEGMTLHDRGTEFSANLSELGLSADDLQRHMAECLATLAVLGMPPDSRRVALWSIGPIGEHGELTRMAFAIAEPPLTVQRWSANTTALQGGRGKQFALYGRLVERQPTDSEEPTWAFQIEDLGTVYVEPWFVGAWEPHSPLLAQITWTPELGKRPRRSIEIEIDEWDDKLYDQWHASAGQAMKFLHNFTRHIAGGRPNGSLKGARWGRREILAWYDVASSEFASDGKKVRLKDLGDAMGVSDETAGNRVRDADLTWPPTPEQLEELYDDE